MRRFPLLLGCLAVAGCSLTLEYEGLEGVRPADTGAAGASGAGNVGGAAGGANASGASGTSGASGVGGVAGASGAAGVAGASGAAGVAGASGATLVAVEDIYEAPKSDFIAGFTVDATRVYWMTSQDLWSVALDDLGKTESLPEPTKMSGGSGVGKGVRPWSLTSLGDRLYWLDDAGNICGAAKTATNVSCAQPVFATLDTKPQSPAHALAGFTLGTKRYLIAAFEPDAIAPGSTRRIGALLLDASGEKGVGEPIFLSTFAESSTAIATGAFPGGAAFAAWASVATVHGAQFTSAPKASATEHSVAGTVNALAVAPEATAVAIGASGGVYWQSTVSLDQPKPLFTGLDNVSGVAFPAISLSDTIYTSEKLRGTIRALPVGGETTALTEGDNRYTIVEGQKEIYDLQTAGAYLYWFTSGADQPGYLRRARVR